MAVHVDSLCPSKMYLGEFRETDSYAAAAVAATDPETRAVDSEREDTIQTAQSGWRDQRFETHYSVNNPMAICTGMAVLFSSTST